MASDKCFADSFIDEDPKRALEELNEALGEKAENPEWLCQRAYAHLLLKDYNRAAEDAKKAQQLQPGLAKAFLRTGIAEYHLNNISTAHQALLAGKDLDGSNEAFHTWIKMCEEKLATQDQNGTSNLQTTTPDVKRDWYQTESQVTVTLMVKNVRKEDIRINFEESELNVMMKLPSGKDYHLDLNLLHPVVPEQSSFKVFSTKVEIKMKKTEAIRWEKLEGEGTLPNLKYFSPSPNQYPSSSHYTRNWDKLVGDIKEEEKNEKLEGDAALNKLFQQIYSDGSDEVRRAMNKSFMESSGTVLSTNWTDVGKRNVDVNPPDDMEWKPY